MPHATSLRPIVLGDDVAARSEVARGALETLVGLYVMNLSEPLPLWPTSAARLCGRTKPKLDQWQVTYPGGGRAGDGYEAATREIWGDITEQDYELLPARDDDPGDPAERRRALRLANVLWQAFDDSVTGSLNSPTEARR